VLTGTQTTWDKEGFPIRDPESTTYVGAIEVAEEFGKRLYEDGLTSAQDRKPWAQILLSQKANPRP
jgi:hypothetical protein